MTTIVLVPVAFDPLREFEVVSVRGLVMSSSFGIACTARDLLHLALCQLLDRDGFLNLLLLEKGLEDLVVDEILVLELRVGFYAGHGYVA